MTPERKLASWMGITGYSELWLGENYLFVVESNWLFERYQRFRLEDICALAVAECAPALAIPLTSAGFAAAAFVLSYFAPAGPWRIASFVAGVAFAGFALRPWLQGPRCRMEIHTATGRHAVRAVDSLSLAGQLMPELDLLIEQKQGARIAYAGDPPSELSPAPPPPPDLGSTSNRWLPEACFLLLLANSALGLLLYYFGNSPYVWNLAPTIALIELTLAVLAVRPSLYRSRSSVARLIAMLALLLMILDWAGGIALAVRNWDVIQKGTDFRSVAYFREYVWIGAAGRFLVGSFGLLFRLRDRSREAAP